MDPCSQKKLMKRLQSLESKFEALIEHFKSSGPPQAPPPPAPPPPQRPPPPPISISAPIQTNQTKNLGLSNSTFSQGAGYLDELKAVLARRNSRPG